MRDGNGVLVGAMGNDAMRYATWALTWEYQVAWYVYEERPLPLLHLMALGSYLSKEKCDWQPAPRCVYMNTGRCLCYNRRGCQSCTRTNEDSKGGC